MGVLERVLSLEIHTVESVFDLPPNANVRYRDLTTAVKVAREMGGRLWRVKGKEGAWYEWILREHLNNLRL